MKTIKSVDLTFENCEFCNLKPDMFTGLVVENIVKSHWINCFQYEKGEVDEFLNCSLFRISINKKGCEAKVSELFDPKSLRERIKSWKDITHVHLHFNDGTDEYIGVPWGGEEYTNTKQKVKFKKDSIEITIKE